MILLLVDPWAGVGAGSKIPKEQKMSVNKPDSGRSQKYKVQDVIHQSKGHHKSSWIVEGSYHIPFRFRVSS